jgi:hypothetical protein
MISAIKNDSLTTVNVITL